MLWAPQKLLKNSSKIALGVFDYINYFSLLKNCSGVIAKNPRGVAKNPRGVYGCIADSRCTGKVVQ